MDQSMHDNTAAGSSPDAPPDDQLRKLLHEVRVVAVIGASTREGRPANYVPAYVAEKGYDVVGVNPVAAGEQLFGAPVFSNLAEVDRPIDMVNLFRRNEDIPGHLHEILALSPRPRAVWIQKGLRHDETAEALRAEGITVIQDRCLMVEHRRLISPSGESKRGATTVDEGATPDAGAGKG